MPSPRLLLVANVNASTVTPRKVSVIEGALSSAFDVDLVPTKRHGHATHLARGAAHGEYDLVVAFGGDGTVNELANGLAGTQVPLSIIPGGGTNVLARSLGIPEDPIEATGELLANRNRPPRRVSLGRAEGRYFTFSCGLGFDGAIVRQVERRRRLKKVVGGGYYVWAGVSIFAFRYGRRTPAVHLRWGDGLEHRRDGLFLAVTQKTSPYTYLGARPMYLCPEASFDKGIDALAVDSMKLPFILRTIARSFGKGRHVKSKHVVYLRDQPGVSITSDRPLPMQMDGEFIGMRTELLVESVPDALSLLY